MSEDMIETLHPDPAKQGARVTKATYEVYRDALLRVIPDSAEGVEFVSLSSAVAEKIPAEVRDSTSPGWWTTTVKLDLEARGMIERLPGNGRQRVRRPAAV